MTKHAITRANTGRSLLSEDRSLDLAPMGAVLLALALSACGGGGGGGGPSGGPGGPGGGLGTAALTQGNAEDIAAAALDATAGVLDVTRNTNVLGARQESSAGSSQGDWGAPGGFHFTEFMTAQLMEVLPGGDRVLAVITTTTEPCAGGFVTRIFNDADNSGGFTTGDSYEFQFNCTQGGFGITGSIVLRDVVFAGTPQGGSFDVSMTLEYVNLRVTGGAGTLVYNGTVTTSIAYRNGLFTYTYGINGTFGSLQGGSSVTYSFDQNGNATYTSSGTVQLAGGGTVGFDTTTPFVGDPSAGNPSAGECVVYGANSSRLVITALDSTNVQLRLDADGDGVFETTITRTWASLAN